MKFAKEFLQNFEGKTIEDKIVDHSRWSVMHERIFEYKGKFYRTYYSVGATEYQDESPYGYKEDEIDCLEVCQLEKVIKVWEIVK